MTYKDEVEKGALVHFHKLVVKGLDFLIALRGLVVNLLLSLDVEVAELNDLQAEDAVRLWVRRR